MAQSKQKLIRMDERRNGQRTVFSFSSWGSKSVVRVTRGAILTRNLVQTTDSKKGLITYAIIAFDVHHNRFIFVSDTVLLDQWRRFSLYEMVNDRAEHDKDILVPQC